MGKETCLLTFKETCLLTLIETCLLTFTETCLLIFTETCHSAFTETYPEEKNTELLDLDINVIQSLLKLIRITLAMSNFALEYGISN